MTRLVSVSGSCWVFLENYIPAQNDVVINEDNALDHLGNTNLREMAKPFQFYRTDDPLLSNGVTTLMKQVHGRGGRFIKKDPASRGWFQVPDKTAKDFIFAFINKHREQNPGLGSVRHPRAREHDVIFGGPAGTENLPGNKNFYTLITNHSRSSVSPSELIAYIREQVARTGGRFVCRDPVAGNFNELSEGEINEKIRTALQGAASAGNARFAVQNRQMQQQPTTQPYPTIRHLNGVATANPYAGFFNQASQNLGPQGHFELGKSYLHGVFGVVDKTLAFRYFSFAANQGMAQAQNALGDCYFNGTGTEQNLAEAAKFYELAARQGLPEANQNLQNIQKIQQYVSDRVRNEAAIRQSMSIPNPLQGQNGAAHAALGISESCPEQESQKNPTILVERGETQISVERGETQISVAHPPPTTVAGNGKEVSNMKPPPVQQNAVEMANDDFKNAGGRTERINLDSLKSSEKRMAFSDRWKEWREICIGKEIPKNLRSKSTTVRLFASDLDKESPSEERIRKLATGFSSLSDLSREISKLEQILENAVKVEKHLAQLMYLSRLDKYRPLSLLKYEIRYLEEKLNNNKNNPEERLSFSREILHLTKLYETERKAWKYTKAYSSPLGKSQISNGEETITISFLDQNSIAAPSAVEVGKQSSNEQETETIAFPGQTGPATPVVVEAAEQQTSLAVSGPRSERQSIHSEKASEYDGGKQQTPQAAQAAPAIKESWGPQSERKRTRSETLSECDTGKQQTPGAAPAVNENGVLQSDRKRLRAEKASYVMDVEEFTPKPCRCKTCDCKNCEK